MSCLDSAAPYTPAPNIKRLSVCLATLVGLGASLASATFAQTAPAQAALTVPAKEAYVDRVMDRSTLPDEGLILKISDYNASGWPRSWRIDYSLLTQSGTSTSQSRAIAVSSFLDTPDYGALSINANLVEQNANNYGTATQSSGSTWRIDQRAVPLDGGWRANYSAGDINSVATPLARGLRRVSLPTTQIRGASAQWYLGDSIDLNAAVGRTGLFSGLDVAGFQTSGGQVATAGGQFKIPTRSGRTDAALQVIDGQNITAGGDSGAQNTRAFWASTAWEGSAPWNSAAAPGSISPSERVGGLRVQGNVVHSDTSREGGSNGMWADAAWRTERWRNAAGVFRFEPNLRWGTALLASDLQGVYWQADTSTRQWQGGFSTELSDSVRGAGTNAGASGSTRSAFFSTNGRYSLDTQNSIGATLNIRALSSTGQAILLTWNRANDWGQTQWRGDYANTAGSRTTRLGIDQNWRVTPPATFNTTLAWEQIAGGLSPSTGLIWGLLGTVSPLSQWSLNAALRGAARSDGSHAVNANVGLYWQASAGWSLALRYTEARGQEPLQPLVVSALTAATLTTLLPTQVNRSIQLVLRYESRAGTATAPIGGLPGTGAGSLSGTVFFDADANGRREASEGGVANVTVILDRRYVSRTDAQGRYEFPAVAAGDHLIELSSDNVPLPWSPAAREPLKASVLVRQGTTYDLPVQRDR